MTIDLHQVLQYWRVSLADGALGEGKFSQRDRKRFVSVSGESLRTGKLQDKDLDRVFKGQPSAKTVSVRFWPLVMARKSSHGAIYADGLPEIVAPVVTEATVDRNGQITPSRNALARDILAPLPSGEFSIGTVEDLDAFLTETPLPDMIDEDSWQDYLGHCRKMVDAVAGGWPHGDTNYKPMGSGFLELAEDANAMVRNIIDLYDKLLAEKPDTPLLSQIALPRTADATHDPRIERDFDRRLGHSNPQFPLSEHQRQVLAYLDASTPGEVIAVNGPPGTGKTTMLLSAVASVWIRAALKGEDPPVVVAASSNNQAVTNIIDAFSKDFAHGDGPLAGRWLPEVESFGIFLAAHSRKLEAARKYQTENFQIELETVEYFTRAKEAYLRAARIAYPSLAEAHVEAVVNALQQEMAAEVKKLTDLDLAAKRLEGARNAVYTTLGKDFGSAEASLTKTASARRHDETQFKAAKAALESHLASESTVIALLGFLPAIKRKRALQARIVIREFMPGTESLNSIAEIESRVREELNSAEQARKQADQELAQAQRLRRGLAEAEARWNSTVGNLGGSAEQSELERRADIGIRFKLFLLATHYWEGRWLLAMEADLADIASSHSKTGKATVVPRWRRRMMLTPCAVATFASLPGKLAYARRNGDRWATEYLYNFIDLLIVDEAGQVLPQVAGASFSLAKRALVIGDTKQIEPISSVPKPVDIANLRNCGLLQSDENWESLSARGLCTTTGSAMRLAQEACQISPYKELEKGLYLFEHRRCYDEIIGYCNALCYNGKLRPLRGRAPQDAKFPALGYLHVDGRAISMGSSRANPLEAQTIAAWLGTNRSELENRYQARLEKIVGVVTPFGRQVREIRSACSNRNISVDGRDGMTIGTVHALQGAECPVVIFSPVYSKHADGSFIDTSPSMLNVTVSRAKDICLVFGDMDVLSTATPGSPRAVLADFLFKSSMNALEFDTEPRSDLQESSGELQMLRDATEHDAFLLKALADDGRRYSIVSPWVIARTIEQVGILSAFEAAIGRGAEIDIYTDPLLNTSTAPNGQTQMTVAEEALSRIGVRLHKIPRLHSKIVAVDSDLLSIGSYNWLSADRQGTYARHETSFAYRGQHLEAEIRTIIQSLERREKR